MSEPNPVNPNVLKWARATAGLSVDDVVRKMNRKRITVDTILSWENGENSPSYIQLERIAYEIYKRPLALFFFPEPPQEETPKQSYWLERGLVVQAPRECSRIHAIHFQEKASWAAVVSGVYWLL